MIAHPTIPTRRLRAASGPLLVLMLAFLSLCADGGWASAASAAGQPVVTGISPAAGPVGGGTTVTITGSGFTAASAVSFGSVAAASFTVVSDTQITAGSPAGSAGAVHVTVVTAAGTSKTVAADKFTYDRVPSLTGISPPTGSTAGGTTVTLSGKGFTGATAVDFGAVAAQSFIVDSATLITATSPPESPGAVSLTVTTPGGASSSPAAGPEFTYVAGPRVSEVDPAMGPADGGTIVTITGTGLAGASAVDFGSTAAQSFAVLSPTEISAKSPAGSGVVTVSVSTPFGTSPSSGTDTQFTYDPPPIVTGINPAAGTTLGGTSVTISGTGLSGATAVHFGGDAAQSFTVKSATQITAIAAAQPARTVNVTVTAGGQTSTFATAAQFTYFSPPYASPSLAPVVFAISPSAGPLAGGTKVTITGYYLAGATAVRFGSQRATTFAVTSTTQIIAVAPPEHAGTVDLEVSGPAGTSSPVAADLFTYAPGPSVGALPVSGAGSTSATLRGTVNPNRLPLSRCSFQYGASPGRWQTTPCAQTVGAADRPVSVSAVLEDLQPATTYRYRLAVTTAAGTTEGPTRTFTTMAMQAVGVPLVGLLLERLTGPPPLIGKLLGIHGIMRAAAGESLVLRCVTSCSRPLRLTLALNASVTQRTITFGRALLLSPRTRIEIDVSARGRLSRDARYAFTTHGAQLGVRITSSGCRTASGRVVRCPRS